MDEFGSDIYVPIILTKRGERSALNGSPPSVTNAIRPVFVVPPVDWDFENGNPKKTAIEHVALLPEQLMECWGGSISAFIDLAFVDPECDPTDHPLVRVFEECLDRGIDLVPVVSPDRSQRFVAATRQVAEKNDGEICIRLPIEEWPQVAGNGRIESLLSACGSDPTRSHLILDLGDEVGASASLAVVGQLGSLPMVDSWKSLTVAGTSMPAIMPQGVGLHSIARREWANYSTIRSVRNGLNRLPSFGDYVIAGTTPGSDVDPRIMSISATLRYTCENDWLVAKGGLFKGPAGKSLGASAVPPAASALASSPQFYGIEHCEFDKWVGSVAVSGLGGGNPELWRRLGTRHHLAVVTEQLANLAATSAES